MSNDYELALLMQQQFENEANIENPSVDLTYQDTRKKNRDKENSSLVDPSWELVDPTPDIYILFQVFDEKYFWKKLIGVCVMWSKRLTTCAGICAYGGYGSMCKITLSEPLLKLRPRKDLVETLLHEMIHAYLFLTDNKDKFDRDGHGPEFQKHMFRINKDAGTNITIYHDFHDEVELYKTHWWRCDGPCQQRAPYFGMVRRATNRAPSKNDRWWADHQRLCGGTFIKFKEPEKPPKKNAKTKKGSNSDIRNFIPVLKDANQTSNGNLQNVVGFKDLDKQENLNSKTINKPIEKPGNGNLQNVVGFKDLNKKQGNVLKNSNNTVVVNKTVTNDKPAEKPTQTKIDAFSGKGNALDSGASSTSKDYTTVRNHWNNKFPNPAIKRVIETSNLCENKKLKVDDSHHKTVACPVCNKTIRESELNSHLDLCLTEQEDEVKKECPMCRQNVAVNCYEYHVQTCFSDMFGNDDFEKETELIKCLVCGKETDKAKLNEHLDECMSDKIFSGCKEDEGPVAIRKYNCPMCHEIFEYELMSSHLDACINNQSQTEQTNDFIESMFEKF